MADRATEQTEHKPRAPSAAGSATRSGRVLARGRRSDVPFLLVGWTVIVLGAVTAVLAAALLLVWWLA